jgi:hypothetical protein
MTATPKSLYLFQINQSTVVAMSHPLVYVRIDTERKERDTSIAECEYGPTGMHATKTTDVKKRIDWRLGRLITRWAVRPTRIP